MIGAAEPQTFRGGTVMQALEEVQRQLGPDAVVLSVRKVPQGPLWQAWRKPLIEVMAAPRPGGQAPAAASAVPAPLAPAVPEPMLQLRSHLAAQGLDDAFIKSTLATCAETLSPQTLASETRLREYLAPQLRAYLRILPESSFQADRIVCLIGSSGSGKTNTCAKLAAYQIRQSGRKVAWVCADTISAGAISEARLFTGALGISLHVVYTPEELTQAVAQEVEADLIIVDTPGVNPYQESSIVGLCDFLTVLPNRALYLVAPANGKESDLHRFLATFKPFHIKGLIVTRLDETGTYGNIFNLACQSQLPLAYFASGPTVPDDLQPAHSQPLVSALLNGVWKK